MKIVWIAREDPFEPRRGDNLYTAGLTRSLAACGAQVAILTYPRADSAPTAPANIRRVYGTPHGRNRAWSLLTTLPSDAFRLRSESLAEKLRQELALGDVDAVAIDYYASGWALDVVDQVAAAPGTKRPAIIYVSHHYEGYVRPFVARGVTNPFLRPLLIHDANKVVRLEKRLIEAADIIVTITDEDNESFRRVCSGKNVLTLTPGYDGETGPVRSIEASLPRRVVISGAFDWVAKQSVLRRFLKKAEAVFIKNGIELVIVGNAPKDFVEGLAKRYGFAKFFGKVNDMSPYLKDARIGLMPDDIGGGFKLKYLSYIFAGLPIATIRSQFVGLPLDADKDVIARESMDELIAAIVAAMDDIPLLEGMRQRCIAKCADAFHWSDRGKSLHTAIAGVIDRTV